MNLSNASALPRPLVKLKSAEPPAAKISEALARLEREIFSGAVRTEDQAWSTFASENMGIDEFMETYESLRNELALKRLNGESLSNKELVCLTILNRKIDDLMYRPPAEGHELFVDALAELKRYLATE